MALADLQERALGIPQRDFLGRRHHATLVPCHDLDPPLDRLRKELSTGRAGAEEARPGGHALHREPGLGRGAARGVRLSRRRGHTAARAPRREPLPAAPGTSPPGRARPHGPGLEAPLGRQPAARPRALPALPETIVSKLTRSPAWQALAAHQRRIAAASLRELFAAEASRAGRFSLEAGGLLLDYSKHRIDAETMRLLRGLAAQAQVPAWIARMFAGDPVNDTEGRPALHVALRSGEASFPEGRDVMPEVRAARARMRSFVEQAYGGAFLGADGRPITDIVNIGIGGS